MFFRGNPKSGVPESEPERDAGKGGFAKRQAELRAKANIPLWLRLRNALDKREIAAKQKAKDARNISGLG